MEGLRACCLVKSVVEDRWWPYIKTKIPKPIQVSSFLDRSRREILLSGFGCCIYAGSREFIHIFIYKVDLETNCILLLYIVSGCGKWLRVSRISRRSTLRVERLGPAPSTDKCSEVAFGSKC